MSHILEQPPSDTSTRGDAKPQPEVSSASAVSQGGGRHVPLPTPTRALFARRTLFELLIVSAGVWVALVAENWREARERREDALQVAEAISEEITNLTDWYGGWRATIANDYTLWKARYDAGEMPVPFYFRIPGTEWAPTIGWQAAIASDAFRVFGAQLLFRIGNDYHEWSGIGTRIARYMAATEQVIFPELASGRNCYEAGSRELAPICAANILLMEEVLSEMDQKYDRMTRLRAQVDSAAGALR